jgi:hypothetical protein
VARRALLYLGQPVLLTTNWLRLRAVSAEIARFASSVPPGEIRAFPLPGS